MTDTVQQLHELPDLAAECFATWGHPNSSDRPVVAVKRIHPKAPADLDTLDALRADKLGLLHRLAQCVRAVVEDMHEHPGDLTDTPTWASECAWLIAHAADWRADEFIHDWVSSEVRSIHRELCRVARVHPVRAMHHQCSKCGNPSTLINDGHLWACRECGREDEGPRRQIEDFRHKPSISTKEISEQFGVTEGWVWKQRFNRKLKPDNSKGLNPMHWWPWDVFKLLNPGLVELWEQNANDA